MKQVIGATRIARAKRIIGARRIATPNRRFRQIGDLGKIRIVKLALLFLMGLLAMFGGPPRLWAEGYPHHPVNLSFFYPVSTDQDPETSTNLRLNVIYGDIGAIRGVDLSGVVGRVRRDMVGFQAAGGLAYTEGEVHGAVMSGLGTYVGSDARGFLYSGLVNFCRGDFVGLQTANLLNYVQGDVSGLQATALFNLNDGDVKYVQASSIANAVAGNVRGLQTAGGLNYVNQGMHGVQVALANFAMEMRGVQVGIGNVVGRAEGAQVGVINLATELEGVPVGMINYTKEGDADWVIFGSNLAAASTGIRTIHRNFYSFVALGVGDVKDDRNDTIFLSWHYGYAFPVHRSWNLGIDAGFLHIVPTPSNDPNVNADLHYAIQGRVIAEWLISKKVKLFGGAGISTVFSEYSSDATSETDPLVVLGVSLY